MAETTRTVGALTASALLFGADIFGVGLAAAALYPVVILCTRLPTATTTIVVAASCIVLTGAGLVLADAPPAVGPDLLARAAVALSIAVAAWSWRSSHTDDKQLESVAPGIELNDPGTAQQPVEELRQRLNYALEGAKLGEWTLDMRTREARRTLRHDEIFGYTTLQSDWTLDRMLSHVYPEDRRKVIDAFDRTAAGEQSMTFEVRILRVDGTMRWIWARGVVSGRDGNGPLRLSGVIQDITRRKRHDEANRILADIAAPLGQLDDYEGTLRGIAHRIVPQIADWCAIDVTGNDGYLSRIASAHDDPDRESLVEAIHFNCDASGSSISTQLFKFRNTGHSNGQGEHSDADLVSGQSDRALLDALEPVSVMSVPIVVRDRCIGVIVFGNSHSRRHFDEHDVDLAERLTERIAISIDNAKLYAAVREEDARKDVFLAMLAHELRNPLGALGNGLEVLRQQLPPGDSSWAIEMMERQKLQLVRLLDDLLDVSRVNRGTVALNTTHIKLDSVLMDAVAGIALRVDENNQTLVTQFETDDVILDADPVRLGQIVANLLSNAVKYTPAGGIITLATTRDGNDAVITVNDNGIGIAAEQTERIFDMFVQANAEDAPSTIGLGLGLTLARELTLLHGGTIKATSQGIGHGSTFTVRLPVAATAETGTGDVATAPQPGSGKRAILVVDDNKDSIAALGHILSSQGHEVRLAYDGNTALAAVRTRAPDVILLDIGLPDISGYDVARQVRELPGGADLHLIALTGFGQAEDRRKSEAAGFDEHLVKPVDLGVLARIIAEAGPPRHERKLPARPIDAGGRSDRKA